MEDLVINSGNLQAFGETFVDSIRMEIVLLGIQYVILIITANQYLML